MNKLTPVLLVSIIAVLFARGNARADGMFVAPKFVWDKHRDINEPTQKAIIVYDAGREDLVLQVKYEGPVDEFGWLIPVPNLPTVSKGSMKCFYELSQYTQKHFEARGHYGTAKGGTLGMGAGEQPEAVKVIEVKTVGAYEIAVLSTPNAGALEDWLAANNFYFPTNKTEVLDVYIRQQWYFVAAKINLGENDAFRLQAKSPKGKAAPEPAFSTKLKLASGELHPLQIRFASDRCVFPLKISSVNDRPSEVQVYVLSPEPLLERAMFEKKLPLIYINDLARAAKRVEFYKAMQERRQEMQSRLGGIGSLPNPDEDALEKRAEAPVASPDELLPYAKVTKTDLPETGRWLPWLAGKSWWLTKQTWAFKPEEMHDLEFEAAIPVFADDLGTKCGYLAAANLTAFDEDAVPALIRALQNTNPSVRIDAAAAIDEYAAKPIQDSRLAGASVALLKDSEPKVRLMAIHVLLDGHNWNSQNAKLILGMFRDQNAEVRQAAADGLSWPQIRSGVNQYIPVIREMLKDKDINVRASAMRVLQRMGTPAPREDLLQFFSVPDSRVVSIAFSQFVKSTGREYDLSDQEVIPLLQNTEPFARLLGLRILYQNANPQSVELALPLLKDPEPALRQRAARTLRALTGQHFTEDQAAEWEKWWTDNKTNFVVQLHPEEMRPPPRGTNDLRWFQTNRPPASVFPDNLSR